VIGIRLGVSFAGSLRIAVAFAQTAAARRRASAGLALQTGAVLVFCAGRCCWTSWTRAAAVESDLAAVLNVVFARGGDTHAGRAAILAAAITGACAHSRVRTRRALRTAAIQIALAGIFLFVGAARGLTQLFYALTVLAIRRLRASLTKAALRTLTAAAIDPALCRVDSKVAAVRRAFYLRWTEGEVGQRAGHEQSHCRQRKRPNSQAKVDESHAPRNIAGPRCARDRFQVWLSRGCDEWMPGSAVPG